MTRKPLNRWLAVVVELEMRNPFGKGVVSCSFCDKSISADKIEIMEFRFHRICADNVAEALRKTMAFNDWKKAHPRWQSSELAA
jgi:hypothetical protein